MRFRRTKEGQCVGCWRWNSEISNRRSTGLRGLLRHRLGRWRAVLREAAAAAAAALARAGARVGRVGRIEVGAADYAARTDGVEHDLDVERPVARVVEDEDRGNRDA